MTRQKLAVVTLWMAAAGICFAQPIAISVHLVDQYGAPKSVAAAARKNAAHILEAAGVKIDWQDAATPGGLTLNIVARRTVPTQGDALGYALIKPGSGNGCDCAYLLYPAIEQSASAWRADVQTVLGVAMAHEIGHILLDSNQHSASGVMKADLANAQIAKASQGGLIFTAEQAATVRLQIARRHPGSVARPTEK
jgi:hypothetical protein